VVLAGERPELEAVEEWESRAIREEVTDAEIRGPPRFVELGNVRDRGIVEPEPTLGG
jgi:hypothetical protein